MASQKRALVTYLVAAAKAGERDAVSRLATLWYPALRGHAYRLLASTDGVDDVAQDAWIDIQRGLGALRDVNAFPAWSLRIVSRRVAKAIKQRQRRRATEPFLENSGPISPSHATSQASEWDGLSSPPEGEDKVLINQVRETMASLSPDLRATLSLFYTEDLSVAEIAVALDIPKGTVKSRLASARDTLRHKLKITEE